MVDGINPTGPIRAAEVSNVTGAGGVRVRRRGHRDRDRDEIESEVGHGGGGHGGGGPGNQDQPGFQENLARARRANQAYGSAGAEIGEPGVVMSHAAAILGGGDLVAILRRAGQAIRQLSETLLGVSPDRTNGLVEAFTEAALEWVRVAIARYRSFAANHGPLPVGLSFEDVRVTVDAGHGGLSVEVGGVVFSQVFEFRSRGVVFDIRASGAVRRPSPGFFVDAGETGVGATIATAIVHKVRADLPRFGISEDTEGVCVLIRSEASDFDPARDGGWVIDIDVHVPFDPGWSG